MLKASTDFCSLSSLASTMPQSSNTVAAPGEDPIAEAQTVLLTQQHVAQELNDNRIRDVLLMNALRLLDLLRSEVRSDYANTQYLAEGLLR